VLRGMVRVEHADGALDVHAGQAVVTAPGEWVRYSTPEADGAEYVAVCLPAFIHLGICLRSGLTTQMIPYGKRCLSWISLFLALRPV